MKLKFQAQWAPSPVNHVGLGASVDLRSTKVPHCWNVGSDGMLDPVVGCWWSMVDPLMWSACNMRLENMKINIAGTWDRTQVLYPFHYACLPSVLRALVVNIITTIHNIYIKTFVSGQNKKSARQFEWTNPSPPCHHLLHWPMALGNRLLPTDNLVTIGYSDGFLRIAKTCKNLKMTYKQHEFHSKAWIKHTSSLEHEEALTLAQFYL